MKKMKRIHQTNQTTIYHCLSRTVHGEKWLDTHAKDVFCKILHKLSAFCGIRVLTYCVMSNHFHLLLEVPKMDERQKITDDELVRRFRILYGEHRNSYVPISASALENCLKRNDVEGHKWRNCLQRRMHNLPLFMKMLKHRFTKWHNNKDQTYGTFWAERYACLIVEPDGAVLRKLACYIDLNPVRAGIVNDPACYPWSGYGASRNGDSKQRSEIAQMSSYGAKASKTSFESYEKELYWRGAFEVNIDGKRGIIPAAIANQYAAIDIHRNAASHFEANLAKLLWSGCIYGSQSFIQQHLDWIKALTGRKRLLISPNTG
jgi:putative transposase